MFDCTARESLKGVVVFAGEHEPLIFRRRRGSARVDEQQRYLDSHTPEHVRKLADAGVTWYRMHFFKGFGLKHEAEEIELARRLTELFHEYGIRVELYTQYGTLQYETFLDECPEASDWVQTNELGQPITITYGQQDFRWMPCVCRDGYWEYLKEVLRIGIEQIGADGFGFDNVALGTEPESCHCDNCRRAFVDYLKSKYSLDTPEGKASAKERFGFDVLDHIRPPTWNRWSQPVDYRVVISPVIQEWVDFRCESLRRRFAQTHDYIRSLSEEVVIEHNVYAPWGTNAAFWNGIDMPRLLPYLDAFWNERDFSCDYTKDERLLHRTHAYKLARAAGKVVFTSHGRGRSGSGKIAAAECLAFNSGVLGGAGGMSELKSLRADRPELFTGRALGEVAMLESSRSLATNSVDTHYASVLATQALMAGHVPFELVLDEDLADIGRCRLLILPDVECVSNDMAEIIINYVRSGGGLVMTDRTGWYDQWRRLRPENVLTKMFGVLPSLPPRSGGRYNSPQPGPECDPIRAELGQGRAAYLGRLIPKVPFSYDQSDWRIDRKYRHRPTNWKQFVEQALWAGRELSFSMIGPEWIVADVHVLADSSMSVHLLNYKSNKAVSGLSITLKGRPGSEASLVRPGHEDIPLSARQGEDGVTIEVPGFDYYAILLWK